MYVYVWYVYTPALRYRMVFCKAMHISFFDMYIYIRIFSISRHRNDSLVYVVLSFFWSMFPFHILELLILSLHLYLYVLYGIYNYSTLLVNITISIIIYKNQSLLLLPSYYHCYIIIIINLFFCLYTYMCSYKLITIILSFRLFYLRSCEKDLTLFSIYIMYINMWYSYLFNFYVSKYRYIDTCYSYRYNTYITHTYIVFLLIQYIYIHINKSCIYI